MEMFSNAAVETMSKQNLAFDFAKTMMKPPEEVNKSHGPPVETKNQPPPMRPVAMTQNVCNRPDLTAASGGVNNNNLQPVADGQAQQRLAVHAPRHV
jgi:hypothetical protein